MSYLIYYLVNGEYVEISSETGYVDEPGMPQIPYCVKTFLIPVNTQPAIQIKYVNRKLQKKDILLYPVQPPIPIGESILSWVEPNSDIYNSSNPFPGKYAKVLQSAPFLHFLRMIRKERLWSLWLPSCNGEILSN